MAHISWLTRPWPKIWNPTTISFPIIAPPIVIVLSLFWSYWVGRMKCNLSWETQVVFWPIENKQKTTRCPGSNLSSHEMLEFFATSQTSAWPQRGQKSSCAVHILWMWKEKKRKKTLFCLSIFFLEWFSGESVMWKLTFLLVVFFFFFHLFVWTLLDDFCPK